MKIESLSNPRIKRAVKLRQRSSREELGLTLVDGRREIGLALRNKIVFEEFFFCPKFFSDKKAQDLLDKIAGKGVPVFEVNEKVFGKIAYGDRLEGGLAVCRPVGKGINQIRLKKNPFLVVLDCVEKPGNLGAILRTCEGAGVDAVIVSDMKTDIFNPNVIRASCGAVFSMPVFQAERVEVISFLKNKGVRIFAAVPSAQDSYSAIDYRKSAAVVFGREQDGLDEEWLQKADTKIRIPMKGQVDSLNVSVSTAIVIYEALRQRGE